MYVGKYIYIVYRIRFWAPLEGGNNRVAILAGHKVSIEAGLHQQDE